MFWEYKLCVNNLYLEKLLDGGIMKLFVKKYSETSCYKILCLKFSL